MPFHTCRSFITEEHDSEGAWLPAPSQPPWSPGPLPPRRTFFHRDAAVSLRSGPRFGVDASCTWSLLSLPLAKCRQQCCFENTPLVRQPLWVLVAPTPTGGQAGEGGDWREDGRLRHQDRWTRLSCLLRCHAGTPPGLGALAGPEFLSGQGGSPRSERWVSAAVKSLSPRAHQGLTKLCHILL